MGQQAEIQMLKTHSSPQPKRKLLKELILTIYLNADPVVFRTNSYNIPTIKSLYYLTSTNKTSYFWNLKIFPYTEKPSFYF